MCHVFCQTTELFLLAHLACLMLWDRNSDLFLIWFKKGDNSIASTGNTPTVDAPTVNNPTVDAPTVNTPTINTPTERWGRGAMTTEVKSYIEMRKMGSVVEKGRSGS